MVLINVIVARAQHALLAVQRHGVLRAWRPTLWPKHLSREQHGVAPNPLLGVHPAHMSLHPQPARFQRGRSGRGSRPWGPGSLQRLPARRKAREITHRKVLGFSREIATNRANGPAKAHHVFSALYLL